MSEGADQAKTPEERSPLDFVAPDPPPGWPRPVHVGAAAVLLIVHIVFRDEYFTVVSGAWAGILAAIAMLAVTRYATQWPARLPTLEILLIFLYVQFGLPITVAPLELGIWNILPAREAFESAGLLALGCALAVSAGFAAGSYRLRKSSAPAGGRRLIPSAPPELLGKATAIFIPIAMSWVVLMAAAPSLRTPLAPIITIVDGILGKVPLAVAATAGLILSPSAASRLRFIVAMCAIAIGMMLTSLLMEAVLPMAAAAAVFWRAREKTPIILPLLAVAVLLVLQPVKGTYRQLRWHGDYGVVEAWTEAFMRQGEDPELETQDSTKATRSRMSELSVLAYTIDVVPRIIPHTGGKAYPVVLAALVPRFLWPDKPNLTKAGTDVFTIALGIQTEVAADRSAVGLSLPPHGYLEHGAVGSLAWTFLLGLVFGGLTRGFGSTTAGTLALASIALGLAYSSAGGLVYFLGSVAQSTVLAFAFTSVLHFLTRFVSTPAVAASSRSLSRV